MKRIKTLLVIFLISFFVSGMTALNIPKKNEISIQEVAFGKKELLDLHNKERSRYGKSLFTIDEKLSSAAQKHAEWMAKNRILSHTGANRSSVKDRVGSGYIIYGENIAYGQRTEKDVVRAWMNSSGHRKNILNNYFKRIGFGYSKTSNGVIYWCVVFAA